MDKDLYEVLGVKKNASQEEIKGAYRGQAMRHHPDRGGDEGRFKEAAEAGAILRNPARREAYDRTGDTATGATNLDNLAAQNLVALFNKVLGRYKRDIVKADVVPMMGDDLRSAMGGHFDRRRALREAMEFTEGLIGRISCDGPVDFLTANLEGVIRHHRGNLERTEDDIRVAWRTRGLLRDYAFESDQADEEGENPGMTFVSFTTTSRP